MILVSQQKLQMDVDMARYQKDCVTIRQCLGKLARSREYSQRQWLLAISSVRYDSWEELLTNHALDDGPQTEPCR